MNRLRYGRKGFKRRANLQELCPNCAAILEFIKALTCIAYQPLDWFGFGESGAEEERVLLFT